MSVRPSVHPTTVPPVAATPATIEQQSSLTVPLVGVAVDFRVEVAWFRLLASGHLGSRPLTDNDMNKLLPRRYLIDARARPLRMLQL